MKYNTFSGNIMKSVFFKNNKVKFLLPLVSSFFIKKNDIILGWGMKKSGKKAISSAKEFGCKFALLEDGFIRSINTTTHNKPFSLISDSSGIFYDANSTNDLEDELNKNRASLFEKDEAKKLIADISLLNISKYNEGIIVNRDILHSKYNIPTDQKIVLIPLQVPGDLSLIHGCAEDHSYKSIIIEAKKENPDAIIVVKKHPRSETTKRIKDVIYIEDSLNIISLLKLCDSIYVKSSQVGFEALLLGKKVVTYGIPFYAGWGLTEDKQKNNPKYNNIFSRRATVLDVETLAYTFYFLYTKYKDPYTEEDITPQQTVRRLNTYRRHYDKINTNLFFLNTSLWKRKFIYKMFKDSYKIEFLNDDNIESSPLSGKNTKVIWGMKNPSEENTDSNNVLRFEDGFVRSKKLGSKKTKPLSICLDSSGIYFNHQKPSDLENMLNTKEYFNEFTSNEGKKIIDLFNKTPLTKYNFNNGNAFINEKQKKKQKTILVIGQVEDDASILFSGNGYSNLSLVEEARIKNVKAHVVFKEHPDVTSGKRAGKVDSELLNSLDIQFADSASLASCIDAADEVHTISSLGGLEALMRGKIVYCYGFPFYSGWGLTIDKAPIKRRKNKISIENLVYATYAEYPLYFDYEKKSFSSFEATAKKVLGHDL